MSPWPNTAFPATSNSAPAFAMSDTVSKFTPPSTSMRKSNFRSVRMRTERKLDFRIEVDGGVNLETVSDIAKAGAELLVAGNAVFGHGDIRANAVQLLEAARAATLTRA